MALNPYEAPPPVREPPLESASVFWPIVLTVLLATRRGVKVLSAVLLTVLLLSVVMMMISDVIHGAGLQVLGHHAFFVALLVLGLREAFRSLKRP